MNMLCENDILYIDIQSDNDLIDNFIIEKNIHNVLEQYEVENIIINFRNSALLNNSFNKIIRLCNKQHNKNLTIKWL